MKLWSIIIWACIAIGVSDVRAHDFKDDYGDGPQAAYRIGCGSNVNGSIEIDVDEDWFAFTAQPLKQYTIRVLPVSLWNATLTLVAPDGAKLIQQADSVMAPTASVTWVHFGPPSTYYVGVSGFAEFTTGAYKVAVWEYGFKDVDNDGMKDSWEADYWGSTNQPPDGDYDSDGVENLSEFIAGTDPADPQSKLEIESINYSDTTVSLACQVQPYRYYRIGIASNSIANGWAEGGVITNLYDRGLRTFVISNLPPDTLRFFRIVCVY